MAQLSPSPKQVFFGADGNPLAAGRLYTYEAGTTTPTATYSDSAGVTENTNPVVLDARGEAVIYLRPGTYKYILKDSSLATIYTQDNIVVTDDAEPIKSVGVEDHTVTATGGETLISLPFSYVPGDGTLEVYQNGLMLYAVTHYEETSSTSITLESAAVAADVFLIRHLVNAAEDVNTIDVRLTDIEADFAAHLLAADPHPGYVTTAEGAALITAHEAASDPHPDYLKAADLAMTALSETTLTENTWIDKAHSLGAVPSRCMVSLRCKTTEHGYAVNDEILFSSGYNTAFATDRRGVVINATNVSLFFSSSTVFPDKTTGAPCTLTPAKWAIVVRVGV
jgi:hypothetical protein